MALLLRRQRDRAHLDAAAASRLGQRSPAAADFQHRAAVGHVQPIEDRVQLAMLPRLQRIAVSEQRAGIGQRRVEPFAVEIVAQVVMRRDVAPRVSPVVVAQRMHHPRRHARATLGARHIAQRRAVAHEQVEDRHQIGAGPVAVRPRLVPADRAAGDQPAQRAPAHHRHLRDRSGSGATQQPARTIRQHRLDRALRQPGINPVEYLVEKRRDAPCPAAW